MTSRDNNKQLETDMDEHGDMKSDVLMQASIAMEQYTEEKDISKHLKLWLEEKYGPTWHCIVGSEYKMSFTCEKMEMAMVLPGQRLGVASSTTEAGEGTYVLNGSIFASVAGTSTTTGNKISVVRPHKKHIATEYVLQLDDTVVCKVTKLSTTQVFMDILSVRGVVLREPFAGTLRKEDVRPTDIDKIVMEELFRPGDVVKAAVLSMGDSRAYYLSTAKPGLGVIQLKQ
ncbi:hypothetical protein THRCLA_20763 [Thraustotheca clavata]|uniref:Uncharacterized protein n=1 Tax=Thraustotheca clavata TaxID=74557 RepID=A0A1W0A4D3_9STRA|nr:hypothetical protein THRCLA_20763 [Thraustotheca clavata]